MCFGVIILQLSADDHAFFRLFDQSAQRFKLMPVSAKAAAFNRHMTAVSQPLKRFILKVRHERLSQRKVDMHGTARRFLASPAARAAKERMYASISG